MCYWASPVLVLHLRKPIAQPHSEAESVHTCLDVLARLLAYYRTEANVCLRCCCCCFLLCTYMCLEHEPFCCCLSNYTVHVTAFREHLCLASACEELAGLPVSGPRVCYAPTLLRNITLGNYQNLTYAVLCLKSSGGNAEFALQINMLLQHP